MGILYNRMEREGQKVIKWQYWWWKLSRILQDILICTYRRLLNSELKKKLGLMFLGISFSSLILSDLKSILYLLENEA